MSEILWRAYRMIRVGPVGEILARSEAPSIRAFLPEGCEIMGPLGDRYATRPRPTCHAVPSPTPPKTALAE